MSPLQPLNQMTPSDTKPRQFGITPGYNMIWQPKADEMFGFWIIREFAESCDIFRVILDALEDRICSQKWDIRLMPKPGEPQKSLELRQANDPRIKSVKAFFRKPDGVLPFSRWLRQWFEDSVVIDAAAIYKERDWKGRIASLRVLDGASINRRVTDQAFTPPPPSVAYQQILYGTIWANFTTRDLTYIMRSPRSWKIYGFGQVEKCMTHVGIALRRQQFVADYYISGNMPEAMCFLPADIPIDRVKEFQDWFDTILAGDLSNRRRLRFLPGFGKMGEKVSPNVIFPKEVLLKDPLDEWLATMFCNCLGLQSNAWKSMVNRATAQQNNESAEEEGYAPRQNEIKETLDAIIQDDDGFQYDDIEFVWESAREMDKLKQAQTDQIYVDTGTRSRNQIRKDLGDDPDPSPEADKLTVTTATGIIPIDQADQLEALQARTDITAPPDDDAPPPKGKKKKPKVGKLLAVEVLGERRMLKAAEHARIEPDHNTKAVIKSRDRIETAAKKVFRRQRDTATDKLQKLVAKQFDSSMGKMSRMDRLRAFSKLLRKKKYQTVMFNLAQADAEKVRSIFVNPADWAEKGRDMEPHVTVLWGLEGATEEELNAVTKGSGEVTITLGDYEVFSDDSESVPLVIRFDSPELTKLHDAIAATFPHTETHPEYKPHICVGYMKPGVAEKYLTAGNPLKGHTFTLGDLVLSQKDESKTPLAKDDGTPREIADSIYHSILKDFKEMAPEVAIALRDAVIDGVNRGLVQIDVSDAELISEVNSVASHWANERAAELVGMRYSAGGELIENPSAKYAITDTTRDELRRIIKSAFEKNTNKEDLIAMVQDAGIFSDARAEMIARTEVVRAQTQGNFEIWKKSGLVAEVRWQVADDNVCPICEENDGVVRKIGEAFPSGDVMPQVHPRCACILIATKFNR